MNDLKYCQWARAEYITSGSSLLPKILGIWNPFFSYYELVFIGDYIGIQPYPHMPCGRFLMAPKAVRTDSYFKNKCAISKVVTWLHPHKIMHAMSIKWCLIDIRDRETEVKVFEPSPRRTGDNILSNLPNQVLSPRGEARVPYSWTRPSSASGMGHWV